MWIESHLSWRPCCLEPTCHELFVTDTASYPRTLECWGIYWRSDWRNPPLPHTHTHISFCCKRMGECFQGQVPCLAYGPTPGFWTSSIVTTRRGKVEEIANRCAVRCNETPVLGHLLQATGLNVSSCMFLKQRNSNVRKFRYKDVLQLQTVSLSDFHHWYSVSSYVLVLSLFFWGGGFVIRLFVSTSAVLSSWSCGASPLKCK